MMKIAQLTTVHKRYDPRIFTKISVSLAKREENQVYLLVGDSLGDEYKDAVRIIDVGGGQCGRFFRMLFTSRKLLKKAIELNCDIYHFHDPELIPVGLYLKIRGKKVIYDIHEQLDLQIGHKNWIPIYLRRPLANLYRYFEIWACGHFNALIVPQESMLKVYSRYAPTYLIANFPVKHITTNSVSNRVDKTRLLYSGTISESRGVWNMLNLIVELNKISSDYILTLAGELDPKLLKKLEEHQGWLYTKYLGELSKEEIYFVYKENDIGLVLFNNLGQYYMAYSVKLFEYMQNGLFVVMPDFGDWLPFNSTYKVGINADPNDSKTLASKIDQFSQIEITTFRQRNISTANDFFTWESEEAKLLRAYSLIHKI